jgi:hypothetical protein
MTVSLASLSGQGGLVLVRVADRFGQNHASRPGLENTVRGVDPVLPAVLAIRPGDIA